MRRREFITLLGGAGWPLTAPAQQGDSIPVIGIVSTWSPGSDPYLDGFRQGLREAGYADGGVGIETHWAAEYNQVAPLVAGLAVRRIAAIVLFSGRAARLAKSFTGNIPTVFVSGLDPVTFGLVETLNRPGGNWTGIYFLTASLEAKRLQLLHELAPTSQS